jgi:hypothetical protein
MITRRGSLALALLALVAPAMAEQHDKEWAAGLHYSKGSASFGGHASTAFGLFDGFKHHPDSDDCDCASVLEAIDRGDSLAKDEPWSVVVDFSLYSGRHDNIDRSRYVLMGGLRRSWGFGRRVFDPRARSYALKNVVYGTKRFSTFLQGTAGNAWTIEEGAGSTGFAYGLAGGVEIHLTKWSGLRLQAENTWVENKPAFGLSVAFVYRDEKLCPHGATKPPHQSSAEASAR